MYRVYRSVYQLMINIYIYICELTVRGTDQWSALVARADVGQTPRH